MALDVSALVSYVIENENLLVTKSIFGGKTAELIVKEGTVMTGVKYAEQINVLATDAIFQNGAGCTRVSSGTTSLTQREVVVGQIAVVEDLCVKDLNKTFMSKKLKAGSDVNTLPFEQEYTNLKSATISKQLEIAIWQGDTTSVNANLARFDGLIKLIDNSASAVNGNPTGITVGTGITSANVIGIMNGMWNGLPADVTGQEDVRIFCGWDVFNLYVTAYTALNLFAFAPKGDEVGMAGGEITIPGTNYRLTAVHGLDATKRLFAMRMSNLYSAVDMENEEEKWSMMEDQFKDFVRFKVQFKYGLNVAFPNEIVSFKLV